MRFGRYKGGLLLELKAVIRNMGKSGSIFVPDDRYVEPVLIDAAGKNIRGTYPPIGMPAPLRTCTQLGPGREMTVASFVFADYTSSSRAGHWRWSLAGHRGKTLKVRFTVSLQGVCPATPRAASSRLVTGRFTSPAVPIRLPAWNRDNVLGTLTSEPIADPKALALVVSHAVSSAIVEIRRNAAVSLGRIGGTGVHAALVRLLQDPDRTVKGYAARAAADANCIAAVPALFVLLGDPDPWVRHNAGAALARIAPPASARALIDAASRTRMPLGDSNLNRALSRMTGPKVVPALLHGLNSSSVRVRLTCARLLGRMKIRKAVPRILQLLDRQKADWAHRRLARALADMGPSAVRAVARGLHHRNPVVRRYAAKALGRIRDPRALGPLIRALRRERVPEARAQMLQTLVRISGRNLGDDPRVWQKWHKTNR